MTEIHALYVVSALSAFSTGFLLLLRVNDRVGDVFIRAIGSWRRAKASTSALILVLFSVCAATGFAAGVASHVKVANGGGVASHIKGSRMGLPDDVMEDLAAYVAGLDGQDHTATARAPNNAVAQLPDVDTMIKNLVLRLQQQPNDVEGWKTLGWSFLNTGQRNDAIAAYQTALKLKPGDPEIQKGLQQAIADQRPDLVK